MPFLFHLSKDDNWRVRLAVVQQQSVIATRMVLHYIIFGCVWCGVCYVLVYIGCVFYPLLQQVITIVVLGID